MELVLSFLIATPRFFQPMQALCLLDSNWRRTRTLPRSLLILSLVGLKCVDRTVEGTVDTLAGSKRIDVDGVVRQLAGLSHLDRCRSALLSPYFVVEE